MPSRAVSNRRLRVSACILIFIEIPLLLRICPTSSKFDAFIRRFTTNYMRAAVYGIMSLVQWLSLLVSASSLIAAAVVLLIAGTFYALAGLKHQEFVGSKTLGGHGVAQMIVWVGWTLHAEANVLSFVWERVHQDELSDFRALNMWNF